MKYIIGLADLLTGKQQRNMKELESWARNEYKNDQEWAVHKVREFGLDWIDDRNLGS